MSQRLPIIAAAWLVLMSLTSSSLAQGPTLVVGFTEPNRNVNVAFSQPGRLKLVNIEEGQSVQQGEMLASLEEMDLVASQSIAEVRADDKSEIEAAEAERDSIQTRLSDLSSLVESGGASTDEVRRVASDLAVAEAKVQTAKAEQRVQELEVKRFKTMRELRQLKSPLSGHIKEIHKHEGEYVSTNDPQVLEIVQLDPLKVRFHVPQEATLRLSAGQSVEVTLPQLKQKAAAMIHRISPLIDPESGTTVVEIRIANPNQNFQSGLRCELKIPFHSISEETL